MSSNGEPVKTSNGEPAKTSNGEPAKTSNGEPAKTSNGEPIKTNEDSEWTLEEEIERNESLRKEDVDSLKRFSISLPKVDDTLITDQLLVALLHSAEYNLERAQKIVTKYFEIRFSAAEVFTGRELDSDDVQNGLEVGYYLPLPKKTPKGFRVVIQGLRNPDISLFNHQNLIKSQTLIMDSLIHSDPTCNGYVFVCDMQGGTFGHIWKQSLLLGKKIMKYSQEGAPLLIRELHVLNTNSFTHTVMKLFKPFISQHLWDMFSFYTPEELDKFHEKISPELLPKEYGGELPERETLYQEELKWLRRVYTKLAVI